MPSWSADFNPDHPAIPELTARFEKIGLRNENSLRDWLLPILALVSLIALSFAIVPKAKQMTKLTRSISSIMFDTMTSPTRLASCYWPRSILSS